MPSRHKHHPTFSGCWIHPVKGDFPLSPAEHHSHFFQTHRSLFGSELNAAYEDGWVSIRRWVGDNEVWAIRYHALGPVASLLCKWAQSVLELHPDEGKVPIHGFSGNGEPSVTAVTIEAVAQGKLALVLDVSRWEAK